MGFGNHIDNLVEGAPDEIHELKFSHRTHACKGSAVGSAHDGRLGDRRIDHALGTEAVDKSVSHFESASIDTDVLADAEDSRVAFHLFPDSLADGFEISELGHRFFVFPEMNAYLKCIAFSLDVATPVF